MPSVAVTETGRVTSTALGRVRIGRRLAEGAMIALARILVRVFFRSVEMEDGGNLPASGPVVLVANHVNGLVDALLLMAVLRRYPRFLGKAALFRIVPLRPFLKLGGVIPVYRAIDGEVGDRNATAFAKSSDLLAQGGLVAVFPEGISHNEPTLQPLRTGAARIALEAGVDRGRGDLVMVAVGLIYDAKARFRSRALVRVGESAAITRWSERYGDDQHRAVRELTDEISEQLARVSPSYTSWSRALAFSTIADIVVRPPRRQLPVDVGMADQAVITQRLAQFEAGEPGSSRLAALMSDFDRYRRDLALMGLSDAQVAAEYPIARLGGSLAWTTLKVILAAPFAAIGWVVHFVPFQIMKQLAKKPDNEGIKATVKLLGCAVGFATTYIAIGVVSGEYFGPWVGLSAALAAPVCGYAAVRLVERSRRIGGIVDGYRTLKARPSVLEMVGTDRQNVVRAASAVLGS